MTQVKLIIPERDLADIDNRVLQSPAILTTLMKRSSTRLRSRWLKALRVEPGKPPAGITRLMTPRQRKFVMAKLRREGNLPYQRTHELTKAWDVQVKLAENGSGDITASNSSPIYDFVYGIRRQSFIEAIGWLDPAPLLVQFEKEAEAVLDANWVTAADITAGVR